MHDNTIFTIESRTAAALTYFKTISIGPWQLCCIQCVFSCVNPSQFDLSRLREHHLTAHDISMAYSPGMKVVQSFDDLGNDEGYLLLFKRT